MLAFDLLRKYRLLSGYIILRQSYHFVSECRSNLLQSFMPSLWEVQVCHGQEEQRATLS